MEDKLIGLDNIRRDNITWTIAEDYNFIPDYRVFEFTDNEKINMYKSALAGFFYEKFHVEEVYAYLDILTKNNPNSKDFFKVTELILEEYFWDKYSKYRPGIMDFRDYTVNYTYEKYRFRKPIDLSQELEYAFYSRKLKVVPKTNNMVILLLNDIMNISTIENTSTLITRINKIFYKHFHINNNLKFEQDVEKIIEDTKDKEKEMDFEKTKPKIQRNLSRENHLDKDEIEAAEFNKSSFLFEDSPLEVEENESSENKDFYLDNDNLKTLAEKVYGKNILNTTDNLQLENKLSTGIHKGIKILITEGKYGNTPNEQFRESEKEFNKEENLKHFNKNILIYKRSITKLKDVLQREIFVDLEDRKTLSTNGRLIPSLMWKAKYLNDDKIFYKDIKDDLETVSVDILLDSSASQLERQELVAAQGYIISQALTELNIPTRVMSFNNFYNILILRLFKDYNDKENKNQNIFEYTTSGANRDGLAIKTISHFINKLNYKRKILIILSDGKPNDKINLKRIGNLNIDAQDYVQDDAIRDTAKEVFLSRSNENIVLGVFTGNEEDLPSEKRIYGTDFAYISDINRFSDIVGNFLKNVFRNIIE